MDLEVEETRYPFESAVQFFGQGYVRDISAAHLTFAWVAAVILILGVLSRSGNVGRNLLVLYFGLAAYNNYAFQVLPGSSLGDIFGVLAVIHYAIQLAGPLRMRLRKSPVGASLCLAAALMATHALAIGIVHPELNAEGAGLMRIVVIAKVMVLGMCCFLFDRVFTERAHIDRLIRTVVTCGVIALVTYIIQGMILLTGRIPYGTFLDAGYIGFPSFASIAVERGHFGKLMTPLFPFFLYAMMKHGRWKAFATFVMVTLVNFSASSMVFAASYTGIAALYFRRKLMRVKIAMAMTVAAGVIAYFVSVTWVLWTALIDKVDQLVFQGDAEGGRDFGTFALYLEKYPFGISYGGSSVRFAPGLDGINMGIFAFISQLSVLAVPISVGFVVLMHYAIRCTRHIADRDTRRVLKTGILMMPLIFAADILWFMPVLWLPLIIAVRLGHIEGRMVVPRAIPEVDADELLVVNR